MDMRQGEQTRDRWARYWARRYATCNLPYEDLLQEGRIALWQGRKVRTAIRDAIRKKSRLIYLPSYYTDKREYPVNAIPLADDDIEKEAVSPDWTEDVLTRIDYDTLLQSLSPRQREVLKLVIEEQMTVAEVATEIERCESMVWYLLRGAIRRLRKEVRARQHGMTEQEEGVLMCQTPIKTEELTATECEYIALIGKGMDTAEIIEHQHVSKRTVDFHLGNIYRKLGVKSLFKVYFEAKRRGLIS